MTDLTTQLAKFLAAMVGAWDGTVTGTGTLTFGASGGSGLTTTGGTMTGTITSTMGIVTASTPVVDATETWNNSGVTFTGFKQNITNTASAAASKLLDLQVGGSSLAYVDVTGYGVFANGLLVGTGGSLSGASAGTFRIRGTSGTPSAYLTSSTSMAWVIGSDGAAPGLGFAADGNWGAPDVLIRRGAAAVVQLGTDLNGAALAQTLQSCNGITGTDKAGANFTIQSGKGTGDGTISSLFFKTPALAGSGTTAQTLTTRLTIDSSGILATGYKSSDGTAGATAGPFTTITAITVKNGLVTALTGS